MFRRARTALVAAALLASTTIVSAQDVVDHAMDWSGAYAGLFTGGVWGNVDAAGLGSTGISGGVAGTFAGYNVDMRGVVFGVEADLGKTAAKGTGVSEDGNYTYGINWNAHLRGRIGLAVEHALFYLSGGAAVASGDLTTPGGVDSQMLVGSTIGGGVEFTLTPSLLLRVEYLHDSYGNRTYTDSEGAHAVGLTTNTIRAGLAGKF